MTLILELPERREATLKARAQARGVSAEEYARQVLDRDLEDESTPAVEASDTRPIWEVITEIMKDVPDDVFDRLPKDGASQVDHYIYGLRKRY